MGQKIHLTKDQVDEIYKLFTSKAVKDSDFPATNSISAEDEITILQNALNKRITYSVILQAILDRVAQGIGGKGLSTEDFTTELKNKLIGIESGAEVNILEGVKVNGVDLVIDSNKKVNVLVPDVSQFITNSVNNLLNYYKKSETYTKAEVAEQIANAINGEFVVVNSLPTASSSTLGKIYLVPTSSPEEQNIKDEFITIHNNNTYSWEKIGSTAVSLSGYVSYEQAQYLTEQQKIQARKNIDANAIFVVHPGGSNPTTFDEIVAAVASGKVPMILGEDVYQLNYLLDDDGGYAEFTSFYDGYTNGWRCEPPNIWSSISPFPFETTQNKVIEITQDCTNDQYASARAVKNYVDNHVPTIDEATNSEIDALFV